RPPGHRLERTAAAGGAPALGGAAAGGRPERAARHPRRLQRVDHRPRDPRAARRVSPRAATAPLLPRPAARAGAGRPLLRPPAPAAPSLPPPHPPRAAGLGSFAAGGRVRNRAVTGPVARPLFAWVAPVGRSEAGLERNQSCYRQA